MDECVKSLHTKQDGLHTKICALQDSLGAMKRRLHDEKSKHRKVMFDEELKCKQLENKIQELNSLEETNNDLRDELKDALSEKSRATRLTAKAKKLASHRLEKWHIEREHRSSAEDEVAHLNKSAMQMNKIIEEYRMVIEQSQKSKRRLKKFPRNWGCKRGKTPLNPRHDPYRGEVAEWSNAAVSKTVVGLRRPRVRIPVPPPFPQNSLKS